LKSASSSRSPSYCNTGFITVSGVSSNGSAHTFAITTSVASAGIPDARLVVRLRVDKGMAFGERTLVDDSAGRASPVSAVRADNAGMDWVLVASWARTEHLPCVTEFCCTLFNFTLSCSQIVHCIAVVVTAETACRAPVHWIQLDVHTGAHIPHDSQTDVSFDDDEETALSDVVICCRCTSECKWISGDNWF